MSLVNMNVDAREVVDALRSTTEAGASVASEAIALLIALRVIAKHSANDAPLKSADTLRAIFGYSHDRECKEQGVPVPTGFATFKKHIATVNKAWESNAQLFDRAVTTMNMAQTADNVARVLRHVTFGNNGQPYTSPAHMEYMTQREGKKSDGDKNPADGWIKKITEGKADDYLTELLNTVMARRDYLAAMGESIAAQLQAAADDYAEAQQRKAEAAQRAGDRSMAEVKAAQETALYWQRKAEAADAQRNLANARAEQTRAWSVADRLAADATQAEANAVEAAARAAEAAEAAASVTARVQAAAKADPATKEAGLAEAKAADRAARKAREAADAAQTGAARLRTLADNAKADAAAHDTSVADHEAKADALKVAA